MRLRTTSFREVASTNSSSSSSTTLRRGSSFVQEYNNPGPELTRGPSMLKGPFSDLLPPAPGDKYTIVLDLDETVIYARNGPLEVRPYFDEFLTLLDGCCEVVAWTAAIRSYAKAVVRNIDRQNVIAHLVYRHQKWFEPQDYTKDLTMLGRPLDKVLIVENTPDCVRNNPQNGVIVQDYEGGAEKDQTMRLLASLVQALCQSGETVPHFLANSPLVQSQTIGGTMGDVDVYFLKTNAEEVKVVKENRDRAPATAPTATAAATPALVTRGRRSPPKKPQTPVVAPPVERRTTRSMVQSIVQRARRSSLMPAKARRAQPTKSQPVKDALKKRRQGWR